MCSGDLPDNFWKGKQVWCGLDLSMTNDNTSFAMVTEQDGTIYAKVWGSLLQIE